MRPHYLLNYIIQEATIIFCITSNQLFYSTNCLLFKSCSFIYQMKPLDLGGFPYNYTLCAK